MAIDTTFPGALRYLEGQDMDLLLALGHRRSYSAGDTLYARGERVGEITIIEDGDLEVELAGERRHIRGGAVFGAESLGGITAAEATARAATDLAAVVVSLGEIEALARTHPETTARLCLGIAVELAAGRPPLPTVGDTSWNDVADAPEMPHPAPVPFDGPAGAAHAAARRLQRSLAAWESPGSSDEARWARESLEAARGEIDLCVNAVARAAQEAGAAAPRVVESAREALRPLIARSRLAELMNARSHAEPARYRSIVHIYRNHPEGDAPDGLLLDAYLLDRPFSRALRERRAVISERLNERVRLRTHPERVLRVLSLGCGPARALADVLEQPGMAELLSVTAVDDDQEAIVYANNLLKSRAPNGDITFHQSRPTDLNLSELAHRSYDVVASLFVADYLDTATLAATIGQAYQRLNRGGVVLMGAFTDAGIDRRGADLFLNWQPAGHSAPDLLASLRDSPFGESVAIDTTPAGLNLVVSASRAE